MGTELNAAEKAYKKLNSITQLTISLDEWLTLLACGLALIVPDLTGIPTKYGAPTIVFVVFSTVALIRRKADWKRGILVSAFGCFVLFVFLALTSKH
jgi:hypothetical protein